MLLTGVYVSNTDFGLYSCGCAHSGRIMGIPRPLAYLSYARKHGDQATPYSPLQKDRPAPIQFWYRESPQYLYSFFPMIGNKPPQLGVVSLISPPPTISGMTSAVLDSQGRLISFSAVPLQVEESSGAILSKLEADWTALFTAAGLDQARFTPTDPQWTPPTACDARAAWTGVYPEQPEIPLRIEAAAFRGRPVYFQMINPWTLPDRMPDVKQQSGPGLIFFLGVVLPLVAVLIARRNLRRGSGDRQGAFRLAIVIFSLYMLKCIFEADHVSFMIYFLALGMSLVCGVYVGLYYLGFEPYMRRRWPQPLITWNRLLEGRFNDPLIGRDILVGVLCAIGILLVSGLLRLILPGPLGLSLNLDTILSLRHTIAFLLQQTSFSIIIWTGFIFFFFLLRALLRSQWLAAGAWILGVVALHYEVSDQLIVTFENCLFSTLLVLVLIRFGVISTLTIPIATGLIFLSLPPSMDFSSWYARSSIVVMFALLALTSYAFFISLGGQKVFAGKLLEE